MTDFKHMSFDVGAYLGDTRHLTTIQHGAYLLLLFAAWRSRGRPRVPDDDKVLARIVGVNKSTWVRMKPIVMDFWTLGEDGFWTQKKQLAVRERAAKIRAEQSAKSNARWHPKPLENNDVGNAGGVPVQAFPILEIDSVSKDTGAELAPFDAKKALFSEGLSSIRRQAGLTEAGGRKLLGKWLKACGDDAAKLLTKIRQSEADQRADAIAWITASLSSETTYTRMWARA